MRAISLALGLFLAHSAGIPAASRQVSAKPTLPEQIAQGERVFARWCAACHAPGPGHPGTQALAVKYKGNPPAELERRTDLAPETVRYFVRNGVSLMSFFRKTEISDAELEALTQYLNRPVRLRRK